MIVWSIVAAAHALVPGFAVLGMNTSELILQLGETRSLLWTPKTPGVFPFYCTDFCSALHQEMQGYARVSPAGSSVPLIANVSERTKTQLARAAQIPTHKHGNN